MQKRYGGPVYCSKCGGNITANQCRCSFIEFLKSKEAADMIAAAQQVSADVDEFYNRESSKEIRFYDI